MPASSASKSLGLHGDVRGRVRDHEREARVENPDVTMCVGPFTSFFLDGLRVVAAIGVVLAHLANSQLAPAAGKLQPYGHLFVVAFFVLSGYLISATTDLRRCDGVRYFASRLSRLWTVALPGLGIALLLELGGQRVAPEHFGIFERGYGMARYAIAAVFCNELWFFSAAPQMVLPMWSLAYEFWFYVMFGIATYIRKPLVRLAVLLITAAFVGPKILALLPVWLLGVFVWKLSCFRERMQRWYGAFMIGGGVLIGFQISSHPTWPTAVGAAPLFFSGSFVSDFIFGLGVCCIIIAVDARFHASPVPSVMNVITRKTAAMSFSLYVLHFPLMTFFAAVLPYDHSNAIHVAGVLVLVFVLTYFFGCIFEPQRKVLAPRLEHWIRVLGERLLGSVIRCGRIGHS